MMGGDPGLGKQVDIRPKFWVRLGSGADEQVWVVRAGSRDALLSRYPQLEIFDPEGSFEAGHAGELFREFDLDKDRDELDGLFSQAG